MKLLLSRMHGSMYIAESNPENARCEDQGENAPDSKNECSLKHNVGMVRQHEVIFSFLLSAVIK